MTTLEMDSLSNIFLDPMMISSEDKLDLLTTTIEESEIFSEQHEVKNFLTDGTFKNYAHPYGSILNEFSFKIVM